MTLFLAISAWGRNVMPITAHILTYRFRRLPVGKQWDFTVFAALVVVVFAATLVGSCAVKLALDYDKAIFNGLTKINEDAMTLFASVSSGAPKRTYPNRKAAYDGLIGKLNAVRIQIDARLAPNPPLFITAILSRPASAAPPDA